RESVHGEKESAPLLGCGCIDKVRASLWSVIGMKKVAVIGGGITGLAVMHYLQKLSSEKNVDTLLVLLEKDQRLGGNIRTVKNEEFIMETGADSIVARHGSVWPLVEELGLESRIVYNGTGISYLYTDSRLHPIPKDTVFGIPMDKNALFRS